MSPLFPGCPGPFQGSLLVCVYVCVCVLKDCQSQGRRKEQVNFCVALELLVQLGGKRCWSERGQLVLAPS